LSTTIPFTLVAFVVLHITARNPDRPDVAQPVAVRNPDGRRLQRDRDGGDFVVALATTPGGRVTQDCGARTRKVRFELTAFSRR
jgi:hypothetical protein